MADTHSSPYRSGMHFLVQHVVAAVLVAFFLGQMSAAALLTTFRAPDAFPEAPDAYGPVSDRPLSSDPAHERVS